MRGIIEIVLAIAVLVGGGKLAFDKAGRELKKVLAEKIKEQGSASLGDYTRQMTGSDSGL